MPPYNLPHWSASTVQSELDQHLPPDQNTQPHKSSLKGSPAPAALASLETTAFRAGSSVSTINVDLPGARNSRNDSESSHWNREIHILEVAADSALQFKFVGLCSIEMAPGQSILDLARKPCTCK